MPLTEQEEIEYLQLLADEDYYQCEQSLPRFVRSAWHLIEPATPYIHNWHIDLLCEYLTAVHQGQIKRLIINLPFRNGKSILASIMYPCWAWIHKPESRWIFSSYSQDLSTVLSIKRRRIIQSEWYQSRWGGKETITTDTNIKTWFANTCEGFMKATSTGGALTGEGGNFLIVDDILKASEITSEAKVKTAHDWFDQTLSTRLNDRKKDAIIVIMQRLGVNDLTSHLLAKHLEDDLAYEVISLPMVEWQTRTIVFPMSGKQMVRREGQYLWEAKNGEKEVQAIKEDMGRAAYEAQCQQNPQVEGGNLIKRDWWRYYRQLPVWTRKTQSWDTALKVKQENDFSVCVTVIENETGYYITDVWRQKVESPELVRAAIQLYDRELPNIVLIEEAASGYGLIQTIQRNTKIPVKAITPTADKVSRLNAVSPTIEAGRVYLPESAVWVADFINEFSAFPNGNHDDQVDALIQFLNYARIRPKATEGNPFLSGESRTF